MMHMFEHIANPIAVARTTSETNRGMKSFHYHNGFELYYLIKGTRNYVVNDEYYSLIKGDMVLIKPGILHKASGGAYDRILINFTPNYLNTYFSQKAISVLLKCFDKEFFTIPFEHRNKVVSLFEKISVLLDEGKEELTFVYVTELLNLLCEITNQLPESEKKRMDDESLIEKILHYINKSYTDIENISQISEKFFITKQHLCRIFKNATNTSVIEYLNRVKIKKACSLLEESGKSILEISLLCGFNSSGYFCKVFKKYMNLTPAEYRKNCEILLESNNEI